MKIARSIQKELKVGLMFHSLMFHSLPMIYCRPVQRSALSVFLFAVFVLPAKNVSAQSVLLSSLKTSEQMASINASGGVLPKALPKALPRGSASLGRPLLLQKLPPRKNTVADPFLNPGAPPASPSQMGSASQSSCVVEDALVSPKPASRDAHEDLDALLWLRTSVEFDALTRQTFAAATQKLGEALVNPDWHALVEAERTGAAKPDRPPCVVVDVDETLLDNSVFQLERIQSDTEYQTDVWNEFVQRRASPAIEGAVDFVKACRAGGVKVFFVTNREAKVEAATRDNLISQGLMNSSDPDQILSKDEQPEWTSDKATRRREVGQKYRVLLLVGDDLNDFLSAKNLTIAQRKQLYVANQKNWGQSWFVVPNPNYGSWEQATIGNDYRAPLEKKRELKMRTLGADPQ